MPDPILESNTDRTFRQVTLYYKNTVLELFSGWVEKTPDSIAVKLGSDSLSYKELDDFSDQLALHLRSLGIGRDSLVGIILPRSLEMIVSILAILKAGGAYVPMAPGDGEKPGQLVLARPPTSRRPASRRQGRR